MKFEFWLAISVVAALIVGWEIGDLIAAARRQRCDTIVQQYQKVYPGSVIICFP